MTGHPSPTFTVSGPLAGPVPAASPSCDVSAMGYSEAEFLLSGVATAYRLQGEQDADGRWTALPIEMSDYTTRLLVRRPIEPDRFNGVVVVEWLNVSGGCDVDPAWAYLHRHIARQGAAWVGVSAQKVGIDGGGFMEAPHLKKLAPERYETLSHPGDAFSFDIFTTAARAIRSTSGTAPLGPLAPRRLIAVGESQSAAFLVTYANAIDPLTEAFDAYLIHGRGAAGAGLDGSWMPLGSPQHAHRLREDARVPMLVLQSETDVILMGGESARQPDTERLRLWEVAGAAHADTYMLNAAGRDTGGLSPDELAALLEARAEILGGLAEHPINSGPQQHYVAQAALSALVDWVEGGDPPPRAARLETVEGGFAVDERGIAKGGVRTPWVDAPVARLSGLGQPTGDFVFLFLFGTTDVFSEDTLAALYPEGRHLYLHAFRQALDRAIEAGFLLDADRSEIEAVAAAAYPSR